MWYLWRYNQWDGIIVTMLQYRLDILRTMELSAEEGSTMFIPETEISFNVSSFSGSSLPQSKSILLSNNPLRIIE